jgi:DNA-directed RNA polymerase specialized sigma24 family protein
MNDRRLVKTMRSRDPAAMGAVYDAYAGRLFAFCWFLLRSREAAEVALRDTLIVAAAHIERLRAPDRLAAWLYAIARVECNRRPASPERRPDLPIASHEQDDVDQRIMAWGAVMGLPRLTREVLEVLLRHRLPVADVAAVLAVSPKEVEAALARSRAELEVTLTAELLAHEGPYGCPDRAAILRARQGELNSGLRTRLRRHAEECETCGVFLIDAVAATKVYGLLPYATPARGVRQRVLSYCADPELTHYRDFVADRVEGFTKSGFPVQRHRGWDRRTPYDPAGGAVGPWRRVLHIVTGVAATAAIVGAVLALVRWAGLAQHGDAGLAITLGETPSVRAQPAPIGPGRPGPSDPSASSPAPGADGWGASSIAPTMTSLPSVPPGGCGPAAPPFANSSPLDERLHGPLGPPADTDSARRPTERVSRPAGPSTDRARPSARPTGPARPTTGRTGPSGPHSSGPPDGSAAPARSRSPAPPAPARPTSPGAARRTTSG